LCASTYTFKQHGEALSQWSRRYNGPFKNGFVLPMVLGHEYVAEIVDFWPNTQRRLKRGARVTSQPLAKKDPGFEIIGISNKLPRWFRRVDGAVRRLSATYTRCARCGSAAMAEPVCVGLSYVDRLGCKDDVPLVVGCGAIGLAMIMALKFQDQRPIIASDFSPHRRELALASGADHAVDPRENLSLRSAPGFRWKSAQRYFRMRGVPGVIDQIIRQCDYSARIIVPGWCLEPDHMLTVCAHTKALNIQFGCGPMAEDFDQAVRALGDGRIDPSRWLGGRISLSQVADRLEVSPIPSIPYAS